MAADTQRRHPGGRPTKLTPERQVKIVDAIRAGVPPETAAAYAASTSRPSTAGCAAAATHRQSRSTPPSRIEVRQALAERETRDILLIGEAARSDWRAAAWRLERRLPKRYGRRERHEIVNGDEAAFRVAFGQQPRTLQELHQAAALEAADDSNDHEEVDDERP